MGFYFKVIALKFLIPHRNFRVLLASVRYSGTVGIHINPHVIKCCHKKRVETREREEKEKAGGKGVEGMEGRGGRGGGGRADGGKRKEGRKGKAEGKRT